MPHLSFARLTGLVLTIATAAGAIGFSSADGVTLPTQIETVVFPGDDDLPTYNAAPTTTTTVPPATTTTAAPPPTTEPPPVETPAGAVRVATHAVTAPPTATPPPTPVAVSVAPMNSCESDTMRWMNRARAANGTAALVADGGIVGIARSWATHLRGMGRLHHNPEFASQIHAARPHVRVAAENVGRSTGSVRGVFDSFMGSSGHRAAILNPSFSHAATGCRVDAAGQHWIVVNFWG